MNLFLRKIKGILLSLFNTYILFGFLYLCKTVLPLFSMADINNAWGGYVDMAITPNLPFCEAPFAATPYMAQGASALAHLPYVPSFLLGISYVSPDTIPMLDENNKIYGKYVLKNKQLLWIQFALQMVSSIGGHILPNPRAVLNQEISIALAFSFLFNFLELTTPNKSKFLFEFKVYFLFTSIFLFGYCVVGLMPIIFTGFITTLLSSIIIKDAFGLITEKGKNILLYIFIPTAVILLTEMMSCEWLQTNVNQNVPWHLLFDIMFWQVIGSAIDVIIISPRPGQFLLADDT